MLKQPPAYYDQGNCPKGDQLQQTYGCNTSSVVCYVFYLPFDKATNTTQIIIYFTIN